LIIDENAPRLPAAYGCQASGGQAL